MGWNDLSMQERAEVMKLALENDIYDLNTIREGYNEFAEGGELRNYYDGWGDFTNLLRKGWNKFKDAVQASAVYENPAVMMATGQKVNKQGKVEYNHTNDAGVRQLRDNLASFGEGALGAITAAKDIKAAYQIARHPIQTVKAVKEGARDAYKGIKKAVNSSKNTDENLLYNALDNAAGKNRSPESNVSMLSEEVNKTISQYANSAKNPVSQVHERMANFRYNRIIKNNADPQLTPKDRIVYFEGIDYKNPSTYEDAIAMTTDWAKKHSNLPGVEKRSNLINYIIANQPLDNIYSNPPSPYIYAGKRDYILSRPEIKRAATEIGQQKQYNILKAHDTAHYYSFPNEKSPIANMFPESHYFSSGNNADIAARGSQIKNYFDKKMINENELKYAAENYVNDTGVDNDMTTLFNAIRQRTKTDSDAWKKMATWISRVSPALAAPAAIKK